MRFQNAFAHLPQLREKVTPPERSELRVTAELIASWDKRARDGGYPANWRLSDHELEASRRAVLDRVDPGDDLWIYAYGSLMWDPGFHFTEVRLGELAGYQRRFSHKVTLGRGTSECPALILSLEQSEGVCKGLVFRIASPDANVESAIVWRREMLWGDYCPQFLSVSTPQGDVTALVFCANESHPNHVGELPLVETAAMIANASGVTGTNRQYLELVSAQLANLGIEDTYVLQLAARFQEFA